MLHLQEYDLIDELESSALRVNRAVQNEIQRKLSNDNVNQDRAFKQAFAILRKLVPKTNPDSNSVSFQQPGIDYLPENPEAEKHILSLLKASKRAGHVDKFDFPELLYDEAFALWQ